MSVFRRVDRCMAAWQHESELRRIAAEKRRIERRLLRTFETLCNIKCDALKVTSLDEADHDNLDVVIRHLGNALLQYREIRSTPIVSARMSPVAASPHVIRDAAD
jgi:hypothetical protein